MIITRKHITILGAGNVSTHLAKALQQAGFHIDCIFSRTQKSAAELASNLSCPCTTSVDNLPTTSDIYLFSVADEAIAHLAQSVGTRDALFMHTAGSISIDVFANIVPCYGVMYPLQTFSKQRKIDVAEVPFFVEGNNAETEQVILSIAQSISRNVRIANQSMRKQLHLAAVFACNFSNHCYSLASDILTRHGLDFSLLLPLINETSSKVTELSPRKAQTGPAIRHDENVMQQHLNLLSTDNEKKIYKIMSESIQQQK